MWGWVFWEDLIGWNLGFLRLKVFKVVVVKVVVGGVETGVSLKGEVEGSDEIMVCVCLMR